MRFADPVKDVFSEDAYQNNKAEFYKLYYEVMKISPKHMLDAFFELNLQNWYPDAYSVDKYSWRKYIECGPYDSTKASLLPDLYVILRKFSQFDYVYNIPLLEFLFSISIPIWVVLLAWGIQVYRHGLKETMIYLIPIGLGISYMFAPVTNFRYIFPNYLLWPLMIAFIIEDLCVSYDEDKIVTLSATTEKDK